MTALTRKLFPNLFFHSLKSRIIGTVLLLHAVLMGLVVTDMVSRQQRFMENQLAHESRTLAYTLAVNAPSWLLSRDVNALGELVTSLKSVKHLNLALIENINGKVLASTEPSLFNMTLTDTASTTLLAPLLDNPVLAANQQLHDGLVDSISAISSNGQRIGYARVILDAAPVQAELDAVTHKGVIYTLIAIILGGVIAWLVIRKVTHRLNLLSNAADSIAAGNLAISLPNYAGLDEVSRLARDFSQMVSALELNSRERDRANAALYAEKERALVTLQSIGDAVITTDIEGRVEFLNPVAETLTGWSNAEASGQPLQQVFKIISEITRLPVENPVEKALLQNGVVGLANHTVLIRRDGHEVHIEDSAAPIRERDNRIIGVVLVFHDVGEKRKLAHQLSYQAKHDALTGLINRSEFERELEYLLDSAASLQREHALLYLDLDQFKVVNDTCGHSAGDELLRQLTARIQAKMRESDTFARLGGDEFGVLLENCPLDQAERLANVLLDEVGAFHFTWLDMSFAVGVSIGLVAITASSGDSASVLSAADTACYAAKDKGRNRVQVYSPGDIEMAERHGEMHWVARIAKAFEDDRFRLYYQPIIVAGKNVQGRQHATPGDPHSEERPGLQHFEILLRMLDEENNLVPPGSFIPAAERYNLMVEIDRWVVGNVFNWLLARNQRSIFCAINLSGQSVNDDRFLAFLIDQIKASGVTPQQICFEITETAAISNLAKASNFIKTIKSLGCSFSLDDFGSGMSSFAYLKNLPVDYLKIDGSFVRDMINDPIDHAMVESINNIGHVMGIETIAEFVETQAILEKLRTIGVDYAQGYGIAKPGPLEDMAP
ncbi:MAG: EAL domain-containing protein [Betaproteobacteria bacterium]|nr:EAL domain-containing protein [Betaproteobacteria bacterium]